MNNYDDLAAEIRQQEIMREGALTPAERRDRLAEMWADDEDAEEAYERYLEERDTGDDPILADRFPEAF